MPLPYPITAQDDELVVLAQLGFEDVGLGDDGLAILGQVGGPLVVQIAQTPG